MPELIDHERVVYIGTLDAIMVEKDDVEFDFDPDIEEKTYELNSDLY